ncbi:MAG: Trk system potassium transporter TrkA [Lachnospiraceae bacterium]|nr:Trk system potassium transporter TrkA [Lachnospiraceae bacterium]MDE6698591.1 Trk system potassium transporter TrkA [Lachnospiraceae bacterium]
MKIIIAGDGKIGATLTRQLSQEGYDITLIDSNNKVLEASEERYDIMSVQGNCASMDVLEQAGVREAELLIAVAGDDEVNLLCCMTAHGINSKIHTIARIRNPEYTKQIYEMREIFALSLSINPEKQTAVEIDRLLKYPGFLKRDTFVKGRVEIVELQVVEGMKICDMALSEISNIAKCKILVCAVLRNGKVVTPGGNFILEAGDRIFVTATAKNLTILLKNLGIITHKIKKVMICGGGRVSFYLAEQLINSGITVKIIENDYDRCILLSKLLPDANIIFGDATNEFLLDSEGISECDALVTTTGVDEMNMIISLYGKSCGVLKVITKLGRLENNNIINNLSLGSTISPKQLCCNTIVRYVRALKNQEGGAVSVHSIADGQAEAIEFIVDDNTINCDRPLREIHVKKNILIVCITHGFKTEIPNGDSVFRKGDIVVVVTNGEKIIYQLNDIFE